MESLEIANQIADIIVDKQGEDILILDIREVTTFADYFVICSTTNRRQLDAIQQAIREGVKQTDRRLIARGAEGTPESGWILVDYNSVIVHIFDRDVRAYYQLEELWKNARVVARIQ